MQKGNYKVNSYIINLSTDEKIPFDEIPKEELRITQKKLINQIASELGYEVKSLKIK